MVSDILLQTEKDSLAFLGLLARVYLLYDPPIEVAGESAPTHFAGLNIHACIVDNIDGEVLGVDRNSIHSDQNPLQHGEQKALRSAIVRVKEKRPRQASTTIEQYYRSQMFMAKGSTASDFLRLGATCYTTLEPCPMCASTLLVARMKRVVFILRDSKYGGAWQMLKAQYYLGDESIYQELVIDAAQSPLASSCADLRDRLIAKADTLRQSGIRDTHILDHCRSELEEAAQMLRLMSESALITTGADHACNVHTLAQLKQACNFPVV
jgi:tRNA(Arg) A34 adenosine deaminase TadA